MNGQNFHTPVTKEEINSKLGKFFFACNIAFRSVENKYFQDFVYTLLKATNVDYELPKRTTFSTSVVKLVFADIEEQKKIPRQ